MRFTALWYTGTLILFTVFYLFCLRLGANEHVSLCIAAILVGAIIGLTGIVDDSILLLNKDEPKSWFVVFCIIVQAILFGIVITFGPKFIQPLHS